MATFTAQFDLENGPSRPIIYRAGVELGYECVNTTDNSFTWVGDNFDALKQQIQDLTPGYTGWQFSEE